MCLILLIKSKSVWGHPTFSRQSRAESWKLADLCLEVPCCQCQEHRGEGFDPTPESLQPAPGFWPNRPPNATSITKCKQLMSPCLSPPCNKRKPNATAKSMVIVPTAKLCRHCPKGNRKGKRQLERVHLCHKEFSPSTHTVKKCGSTLWPDATGRLSGRVVTPP